MALIFSIIDIDNTNLNRGLTYEKPVFEWN